MAWVEAPAGFLNLNRAQRISIEPNEQRPGEWAVYAQMGPHRNFLGSFPNRTTAGEWVADLLFGDDE